MCWISAIGKVFIYELIFEMSKFTSNTQITRFMWPTWGPSGSCRSQMGPVLTPWTLLSGTTGREQKPFNSLFWFRNPCHHHWYHINYFVYSSNAPSSSAILACSCNTLHCITNLQINTLAEYICPMPWFLYYFVNMLKPCMYTIMNLIGIYIVFNYIGIDRIMQIRHASIYIFKYMNH